MVRIHVVRASHLVMGAIGVIIAVALVWALASGLLSGGSDRTQPAANAGKVAETEAAFASASAVFAPENAADEPQTPTEDPLRVLIYHTHTHEAYRQEVGDTYVETTTWRTRDNTHNVVRVGEALAEALTECGFIVMHDDTDHEQESLSTAYTRSLNTVRAYEGAFDILVDLHRDAYSKNSGSEPISVDGQSTARLMFLVGNGVGFTEKPYYAENYELATRLTFAINSEAAGLCRPVLVKDGRYNQHLSPRSLLIEVGNNENSLAEALNAVPFVAEAFRAVFYPDAARLVSAAG